MKVCNLSLKLFICFAFTSLLHGEDLPIWITNPTKIYPEENYLVSVGSGTTIEEARQDALFSLSTTLISEVHLDKKFIETYRESYGDDSEFSHSLRLLSSSVIKSENKLLNVQFQRTYIDEKTGRVYVLAVLNKAEAEPIYLDEIKRCNNRIQKLFQQSASETDKFRKYNLLKRCEQIAMIRQNLERVYKIISYPLNKPLTHEISFEKIESLLTSLQDSIKIRIKIKGEKRNQISSYFRELSGTLGFNVSSNEKNKPDLIIDVLSEISQIDMPGKYKYVKWSLIIDLRSGSNGKILKTFTYNGREAGLNLDSAVQVALRSIKRTVMHEFYADFLKQMKLL